MKLNNISRIYFFVIILSIFSSLCAVAVFVNSAKGDDYTLDNLITFVVTILSMLIAVLAYHISVKTYISIDTVNAISRMDGNVMENENYRTNIISMIRYFNSETRTGACNQVLGYIENNIRNDKIYSGAKLADSIQEIIDVIVLFSFLIKKVDKSANQDVIIKDDTIRRIESLISLVDSKVSEFEQMSEGACILVRESVKLLKAVYTYQSYRLGYKSDVNIASLFDVRGAMLKNAMSRTIYYNYVGLVYMNKAMTIINNCFTSFNKSKIDVLSIEAAKILEHLTKSQDKDLAIIYLKEAIANFDSAVQTIRDELMWNAFIQYNKARSQYILSRLCETSNTTWQETMALAIEYRSKLVMILNDILGVSGKSYLQRAFIDQLKLAQLMNVRLKLAVGSNIDNDCWSYDIGIDEFNRLTDVKEDIYNHIEKQTTIKPKNKKRNK